MMVGRRVVAICGGIIVGLGVMTAVHAGLQTVRLGPDWAFDCSDLACDAQRFAVRRHSRIVAAASAVGVLAGWILVGASRPVRAVPDGRPGGRWWVSPAVLGSAMCLCVMAPLGIIAILMLALVIDPAAALAAVCAGGFGLALIAWRGLRDAGVTDRTAWFLAGTEVALAGGLFLAGSVVAIRLLPVREGALLVAVGVGLWLTWSPGMKCDGFLSAR